VATGSFYSYFDTKEQLFAEVALRFSRQVYEASATPRTSGSMTCA
jgi:AcrR family transcriptional regulator